MTVAADIIERALYEIKASSPINPATPETLETVYNRLVSMLEGWERRGFNTGVLVPDIGINATEADLAEPPDVTEGIVLNLAVLIAPSLGKVALPDTKIRAEYERHEIEKIYRYIDPPATESSGIDGAGNYGSHALNIRTFSE